MPPRLRQWALIAHILTSVGWVGAVIAFLAVAVAGFTTDDEQALRGLVLALQPITWYAIVPLAAATLLTGLTQALGTPWGLLRHYWVLCKLVITVLISILLLEYTRTIEYLAEQAADPSTPVADLQTLAISPAVHAGLALLALLVPTALSVIKPRGITRYEQRRQARQPATRP